MQNILVNRYKHPEKTGYLGWIEPVDGSWILFVPLTGQPVLYTERTETGAVVA